MGFGLVAVAGVLLLGAGIAILVVNLGKARGGAGTIDKAAWDRTAKIAQETKNTDGATVLTKAPDAGAYTNDIVTAALALVDAKGVDTKGAGYKPTDVVPTAGGA